MDFHGADDNVATYQRAMQHVREARYDDALELANQLEQAQYSGAFEVGALACAAKDDLSGAVAWLERGVKLAPKVWLNWQLLGNYLSDLERFDEAATAYKTALECPQVDRDSVTLNLAILSGRQGNADEALALLETIADPALRMPVEDVRIGMLMDVGRHPEAAERCEQGLANAEPTNDTDRQALGRLAGHLARARSAMGASKAEVEEAVLRGLAIDPGSEYLQWALREADLHTSPETHLWRLILVGSDDPSGETSFYVAYTVAHESADQAFATARRVEEAVGCLAIRMEESEERQARPDLPWGVYHRNGRSYFPTQS